MRRLAAAALLLVAACRDDGGGGGEADTDAVTGSTSATTGPSSGMTAEPESSDSSDDAPASSSGSGETGIGECGADSRCMQAPAEGWLGPIATFRGAQGEPPPPCGEGYPDDGLALYEGFVTPDPAQCDCSCELNLASVCQVTMYPDTTSTICQDFSVFIMNGAECTEYAIPSGSLYASMYQLSTPTCIATEPTELPALAWEADVHACTGAERGAACDDAGGVCVPQAPGGYAEQLCIYAQGDNECPSGPFSERSLLFSSVQDDRGCTECECGNAPSINCDGVFDMYDGNDCTGTLVATGPNNACSGPVSGVGSIHVNLPGESACPVAVPSEPEGTAEPMGLFTYCCEP